MTLRRIQMRFGRFPLIAQSSLILAAATSAPASATFSIKESVTLERIVGANGLTDRASVDKPAVFSPSGKMAVIQTRTGDLQTDRAVEILRFYNVSQILGSIHRASGSPAAPVFTLRVPFTKTSGSVREIKWRSDQAVTFLAEDAKGVVQVFEGSLHGTRSLTAAESDVVSYDLGPNEILVYYSSTRKDKPRVVPVGTKSIFELQFWDDDKDSWPLQLYIRRRVGARPEPVGELVRLNPSFADISISTSGKMAIVQRPSVAWPSRWGEYKVANGAALGFQSTWMTGDPLSFIAANRPRYALVDLKRRSIEPLLNAPSGWTSGFSLELSANWARDDSFVILNKSYLPFDESGGSEQGGNHTTPGIIEVSIATRKARWIAPIIDENAQPVDSMDWEPVAEVLTLERSNKGERSQTAFKRDNGDWRPQTTHIVSPESRELKIATRQSLNDPPAIYASTSECKCQKLLLDPSASLRAAPIGNATAIEWADENGVSWRGVLITPPGYRSNRTYPLIIQTHGVDLLEFPLDGPNGGGNTGYAARALASAGFVVLQLPDKEGGPGEIDRHVAGYKAIIDKLVASKMVDRSRVGMITFSRTGLYVHSFLARYPTALAAVSISDSFQPGYIADLLSTNNEREAVELRLVNNGSASQGQLGDWIEKNSLYAGLRSSTPMRVEAIQQSSLIGLWETYAVRKQRNLPIDMVYYPYGEHNLVLPSERLASQGGNYDWFRFWLQGYEDPASEKREQYARWRKLTVNFKKDGNNAH